MKEDKFTKLFNKVVKPEDGIGGSHVEDPTKNPAVKSQEKDIKDIEKELDDRDKEYPAGSKFLDQTDEMTPKGGKMTKTDLTKSEIPKEHKPEMKTQGLEKPKAKKTVSKGTKKKKIFSEEKHETILEAEGKYDKYNWYFIAFQPGGTKNWVDERAFKRLRERARPVKSIIDVLIPAFARKAFIRGESVRELRSMYPGYYVLVTDGPVAAIGKEIIDKSVTKGSQLFRDWEPINEDIVEFMEGPPKLYWMNVKDQRGRAPAEMSNKDRQIIKDYIDQPEDEMPDASFRKGDQIVYTKPDSKNVYRGEILSVNLDNQTAEIEINVFGDHKYKTKVGMSTIKRADE
jgi:hypothetical protein